MALATLVKLGGDQEGLLDGDKSRRAQVGLGAGNDNAPVRALTEIALSKATFTVKKKR